MGKDSQIIHHPATKKFESHMNHHHGQTSITVKTPDKGKLTYKSSSGDGYRTGEISREENSKKIHINKHTGSQSQITTHKKASAGAFSLKNGSKGMKTEFDSSSTSITNDKHGYTEVFHEKKVKHVVYKIKK